MLIAANPVRAGYKMQESRLFILSSRARALSHITVADANELSLIPLPVQRLRFAVAHHCWSYSGHRSAKKTGLRHWDKIRPHVDLSACTGWYIALIIYATYSVHVVHFCSLWQGTWPKRFT